MSITETKYFGKISFEPDSELEFPCGLPGFDSRKRFVAVTIPASEPLTYLQSLEAPDLCFITMPAAGRRSALPAESQHGRSEPAGLASRFTAADWREMSCA